MTDRRGAWWAPSRKPGCVMAAATRASRISLGGAGSTPSRWGSSLLFEDLLGFDACGAPGREPAGPQRHQQDSQCRHAERRAVGRADAIELAFQNLPAEPSAQHAKADP